MDLTKRALRRHHAKRVKQKCKKHIVYRSWVQNFGNDEKAHALGIYHHNRKLCSCFMCGNPRKFNGNSAEAKTIQELIAQDLEYVIEV